MRSELAIADWRILHASVAQLDLMPDYKKDNSNRWQYCPRIQRQLSINAEHEGDSRDKGHNKKPPIRAALYLKRYARNGSRADILRLY